MSVVLSSLLLLALVALGIEIRQRRQLERWLDDPRAESTPDGWGAWRQVFSRLQQLRKADQGHLHDLAFSRDHFRRAVETMPDGVVLLDRSDHIDWFNGAAGRLLSLDAQRDVGTLIEQLLRQSAFIDALRRFRGQGDIEPTLLSPETASVWQMLSLQFIPFADGGALLLIRDVSELARTERLRRDFIANVSHELRTPLTVISGFLEQLTSSDPPQGEAAQRFLLLMDEQARRMTRLVGDLLTLSRLENSAEPPWDEQIDVRALLETLLVEARALSGDRHQIELVDVAPFGVRGSSDELRSAFGNLLSNAVRYTPENGRITASWQEVGDELVFAVTDSGIGVPEEHLSRLAERFYRVDKGRSNSTGGTGLGLAIVKHVLARHQGVLTIESEVGKGSTFCAKLPISRKVLPP